MGFLNIKYIKTKNLLLKKLSKMILFSPLISFRSYFPLILVTSSIRDTSFLISF